MQTNTNCGHIFVRLLHQLADTLFNYVWSEVQRTGCRMQIEDVFVRQMQDTMVALEALTEFSSRDTNRGFYTMLVNFVSTSTNGWQKRVLLSKGNFTSYTTMSVRETVSYNIIYVQRIRLILTVYMT